VLCPAVPCCCAAAVRCSLIARCVCTVVSGCVALRCVAWGWGQAHERDAAKEVSKQFISSLQSSVMARLEREGRFYDPTRKQVVDVFLPWAMTQVAARLQRYSQVQAALDSVLLNAVEQHQHSVWINQRITAPDQDPNSITARLEAYAAAEDAARIAKPQSANPHPPSPSLPRPSRSPFIRSLCALRAAAAASEPFVMSDRRPLPASEAWSELPPAVPSSKPRVSVTLPASTAPQIVLPPPQPQPQQNT
jgi:hypothetical protein